MAQNLFFGKAAILLISFAVLSPKAAVITYPAPSGEQLSTDYTVTADGQKVDVYTALGQTKYGGNYSFCSFDFSGSVTITVTTEKSLSKLAVLPTSFGIVTQVSGNTATMTLSQPRNFSFEPNGITAPLLIFANPMEINAPKDGDPGVVYRGPGIYNGDINLTSNQTLYLAGGSITKGAVYCKGNNIKICGRGLIDGNQWGHLGRSGFVINLDNRSKTYVDGIIVRGSWAGTLWPKGNDSTFVTNMKICNSRFMNEDAISSFNSTNVFIENCFMRSDDDCLPIKSGSKNIKINNCVVWCDRARAFCIGEESDPGYCENISITNIDLIHYGMPPFWFRPGNSLVQRNLRFENINVYGNGNENELFHFTPTNLIWDGGTYPNAGSITDVYFKNISISNPNAKILIDGFNETHMVNNVTFNHVMRNGVLLTKTSPGISINQYTSNIRFIDSGMVSSIKLRDRLYASPASVKISKNKNGSLSISGIEQGAPLEFSIFQSDGIPVYAGKVSGKTEHTIPFPPSAKGIFIIRLHSQNMAIAEKILLD